MANLSGLNNQSFDTIILDGVDLQTTIGNKQDSLTFNPPSSNNSNPSTSAQIKSALDLKQDTLTFNPVFSNNTNPCTANQIQTALNEKQDNLATISSLSVSSPSTIFTYKDTTSSAGSQRGARLQMTRTNGTLGAEDVLSVQNDADVCIGTRASDDSTGFGHTYWSNIRLFVPGDSGNAFFIQSCNTSEDVYFKLLNDGNITMAKNLTVDQSVTVNHRLGVLFTPTHGSYAINAGGDINATGYNTSSDNRLKHNEVDIVDGLTTIMKLNPQKYLKTIQSYDENYNLISDNSGGYTNLNSDDEVREEYGFIADDVMQIDEFKNSVVDSYTDGSGNYVPKSLNYNDIFTVLVKAVQEQQVTINELKTRLSNAGL